MDLNNLDALLEDQLKDLYSAENQLLKALPKMAKKASLPALQQAFERHTEETRAQVDRLRSLGEDLGITLGGKKCLAMEGLIKEGSEVIDADGEPMIIDAALVAAAQRVEHYEISAYGTARAIAEHLGHQDAVQILQQILDEESATDEKLTEISVNELLPASMSGQGESPDMERESRPSPSRTSARTSTRTPGRSQTSRSTKSKPQSSAKSRNNNKAQTKDKTKTRTRK